MARAMAFILIALLFAPAILSGVDGERVKDQALVNIENFKFFTIEIGEGEKVLITARIEALSYPVSVFLIKGQEEFDRFVSSDDVNVDQIKGGNISDFNDNFTVIRDFSAAATDLFKDSITIGEPDVYFLVVMLYRDSSMDPGEVLTTRATLVNYEIEWTEAKNEVPYFLIPIAIVVFFIGIGLMVYYFWPRQVDIPIEESQARQLIRRDPRSRP